MTGERVWVGAEARCQYWYSCTSKASKLSTTVCVKGERDWVGAEAMYKAALRIKPGDATILVNFGILVQEWQGDWDMAHTWYER